MEGLRECGHDSCRGSSNAPRSRAGQLAAGWRNILHHPTLRPLFIESVLVNSLILATAPLLAVLMLGKLGFPTWQYGLAFSLPCLGGLVGARWSTRLVSRYGQVRVLAVAGSLRACRSIGLAFIGTGVVGLLQLMLVEFPLITCAEAFNPVFASYRLEQTGANVVSRTLSAWRVSVRVATAGVTGLWGEIAAAAGPRIAIALAGALMLGGPFLLWRFARASRLVTGGPPDRCGPDAR